MESGEVIMANSDVLGEIEKYHIKCKCGRPAIEWDTWFGYTPCILHSKMNPVEWSHWNGGDVSNEIKG